MSNPENLIPADKRSPSEARENGRKGGKASGKARRRKADAKKVMEALCSLPVKSEALGNLTQVKSIAEAAGANLTYFELATLNMLRIAAIGEGSAPIKAYETILKILGQYPKNAVEDATIKITWGEQHDKDD